MKFTKLLLVVGSVVALTKASPVPLFEDLFGEDDNKKS